MYGSETMIWKEKESSRIRAAQMDNLGGFLGIRSQNARIIELCGVTKGERMDNDRIAERLCVRRV